MDFFLLTFYAAVFAVWALRACRALTELKTTPVISVQEVRPDAPFVSVLIPAKNEEENIGPCLKSLLGQNYPSFEILVINDNSSDQTEAVLRSFGAADASREDNRRGAKLKYLNAPPTPEGWTGKNFALHCGSQHARGTIYLFTDADTRHQPASLSASVAHGINRNLRFLTLLPRCLAETFPEKMIQPSAMGFTGLWFPARKVNDPASRVHFANGQYLMIDRALYEEIGGHDKVRGEFLEDFALMKLAKGAGAKIECALGTCVFGTRMYTSWTSLWRGWRRIYLHAFEKKTGVLLKKMMSVFSFSVMPFLLIPCLPVAGDGKHLLTLAAASGIVIIFATALKTHALVKAPRIYCVLHPAAALFLTGVLADAAWMALRGKKTTWR